MIISPKKIKIIEKKAQKIRVDIVKSLQKAGSGHTAGSLGMADVLATLFFYSLRHKPKKPDWKERDRLLLSNGHICPALYAAMAHSGYFPTAELKTLRKFGSRLQGHPHREFLSALETSSGPLGSGLSQAVGMALVDRLDEGEKSEKFFFCLLGDGETNEGQVWEAAMLAGKEKLGSLIAIIDRNKIQIDGFTKDVMPLEPYAKKWSSFAFHAQEIDGHNIEEISQAISLAKRKKEKPSVIIAKTVAGKGVPEWENDPSWHGKVPNELEAKKAIRILEKS